MIRFDVEQGSPEWLAVRCGLPTASRFDEILTPKTMKLSGSADKYRDHLLAEWLLGESLTGEGYDFTERGTAMEDEARAWYEMQHDVEIDRVGFLMRNDRRCGASPDGLIGTNGGFEMKCPSASVHVSYLLGAAVDGKYKCQVQGGLWVSEREWWDVLSYHPSLPRALVRVYRDEEFIEKLAQTVEQFCEYLDEGKLALSKRNVAPLGA